MQLEQYYVYVLANRSHTLYVGVTNDLERRVYQHQTGVFEGFTKQYHITRLVYYETFRHIGDAIRREKHLKGWLRAKKIELIESKNRYWKDLAADWYTASRIGGGTPSSPAGSETSRGDREGRGVLRCAQDDSGECPAAE